MHVPGACTVDLWLKLYFAAKQTTNNNLDLFEGKNKWLILHLLDLSRSFEHVVYCADITACPNSFREGFKINGQLGVVLYKAWWIMRSVPGWSIDTWSIQHLGTW